jgi:hypothetical protein
MPKTRAESESFAASSPPAYSTSCMFRAESEEVPGSQRNTTSDGKRVRSILSSRKAEQKRRALEMLREQQSDSQSQLHVDSSMAAGLSSMAAANSEKLPVSDPTPEARAKMDEQYDRAFTEAEMLRARLQQSAAAQQETGRFRRQLDQGEEGVGAVWSGRDASQGSVASTRSVSRNDEPDRPQQETEVGTTQNASFKRSEQVLKQDEESSSSMSTPETSEDLDDYDPAYSQHASNQSFMATPTSRKRGPFGEGPISGGPLSGLSQVPLSGHRGTVGGSSMADPESTGVASNRSAPVSMAAPSSEQHPLSPLPLTPGHCHPGQMQPAPVEETSEPTRDGSEAGRATEDTPPAAPVPDHEPVVGVLQDDAAVAVADKIAAEPLQDQGASGRSDKAAHDDGPPSIAVDDGSFAAAAAELAAKRVAAAAGAPTMEGIERSGTDQEGGGSGLAGKRPGARVPPRWQSLMQPTAASRSRVAQVTATRQPGPRRSVSGGNFDFGGGRVRAPLITPRQPSRPQPRRSNRMPALTSSKIRPGMQAERSQSTPTTSVQARKPMLPREVHARPSRSPAPAANRRSTVEAAHSAIAPRKAPLDTGLPRQRAMALRSSHHPPPQQPEQRRAVTTAPVRRKQLSERPAFGLSPITHAGGADSKRPAMTWERPWRSGMKVSPTSAPTSRSAPGERRLSRAQSRLMAPTASSAARVAAAAASGNELGAQQLPRKPLLPREARLPPRRSRPASPPRVRPPPATPTRRSARPEVESWLQLDVHRRRPASRGPGWISQATLKRRQRLQEMGRLPSGGIDSPRADHPLSPSPSPATTLPSPSPPPDLVIAHSERASITCALLSILCLAPHAC